jgi:hypothetical protein
VILPDRRSIRSGRLKLDALPADSAGVSVDNRLVEYWRRQLAARRRLRPAPALRAPAAADSEPGHGIEAAVEPSTGEERSNVVPMTFEDR